MTAEETVKTKANHAIVRTLPCYLFTSCKSVQDMPDLPMLSTEQGCCYRVDSLLLMP